MVMGQLILLHKPNKKNLESEMIKTTSFHKLNKPLVNFSVLFKQSRSYCPRILVYTSQRYLLGARTKQKVPNRL